MKHYEKPAMNFVSLRNENTVADKCWGHANKGAVMYCDIEGEGYCSFQIGGTSCTLGTDNLIYVNYHEGQEDKDGTPIYAGDPRYTELESILVKAGGSTGNPYKGTDIVFDNPDPEWS